MDLPVTTLEVLSAMITPVVLISACSSLILTTSNRANRVSDRLRMWSDEFVNLAEDAPQTEAARERRALLFDQLDGYTSRARLLQRSMTSFVISLGFFVGTSVAIGLDGLAWYFAAEALRLIIVPTVISLIGIGFLFHGSLLLITEGRLGLETTNQEMDYLWWLGKRYAPSEALERRRARYSRVDLQSPSARDDVTEEQSSRANRNDTGV
jgi:hypothetical protein